MDKQKQIEEIEKDIAVRMAMAKGVAGSMNNGVEGWLGKYLIEKEWTKIPENALLILDEEMEDVADMIVKSPQMQKTMSHLIKAWQKETAEEFAERLKES